jgi:enoyl-CoA hydratase
MPYETILVETRRSVGLITLNRPEALNALNAQLISELNTALTAFDKDDAIGCIVITGSEKAFAAGADIREMKGKDFPQTYKDDFLNAWDGVAHHRKPIIAAVAGFALGGGCELALMCDMIIAAENARFGQPEIKIGIIPGAGGTQRLTRAIGKAKAMDLCLTGRLMDAAEAERSGLVSRIVALPALLDEALKAAEIIAAMPRMAALMAKESVHQSFEVSLHEGLRFERRLCQSLFATQDQKEGMAAFIEKRPAVFQNR